MSWSATVSWVVLEVTPSDVLRVEQFGLTFCNYFVIPLLREQMFKWFALGLAVVTWLAFRDALPSFIIPLIDTIEIRGVIQGVAAILCVTSALIYLRTYFKSHSDFYYWHSLGLILFAFGVFFIPLGAVESRIAWLGRASQYAAGIYFLVSVLGAYRRAGVGGVEMRSNR